MRVAFPFAVSLGLVVQPLLAVGLGMNFAVPVSPASSAKVPAVRVPTGVPLILLVLESVFPKLSTARTM